MSKCRFQSVVSAMALFASLGTGVIGCQIAKSHTGTQSASAASLQITSAPLPQGDVGQPYSTMLNVTGGNPGYNWSITAGALPGGLTLLATTGQISGTPSASGQFGFTAQVADSSSPNHTAAAALSISVVPETPHDQYGGLITKPCAGGVQTTFYTEKINNHWWFCTPAGNAFWMQGIFNIATDDTTDFLGVNNAAVALSKYGSVPAWGNETVARMRSWGFNTIGEQGTFDSVRPTTVPHPSLLMPFIGWLWPSHYAQTNAGAYTAIATKGYAPGIKFSLGSLSGAALSAFRQVDPFDPNFGPYLLATLQNDSTVKAWYQNVSNDYMVGWVADDADSVGLAKAGRDFPTVRNSLLETGHGSSVPHYGYVTLISAPEHGVDTPAQNQELNVPMLYSDKKFYAKSELSAWLQGTADKGPGYSSIAALNAAWGSQYTQFPSSGSSFTDTIGIGNGSTTVFSFTLSHTPVTPLSVLVKVGGVVVSGDDGSGATGLIPANTGAFQVGASGNINYSTGTLALMLSTPPASGVAITAQYNTGGWGVGTGLLDEDGNCPSSATLSCWLPGDAWNLTGGNVTAAFRTDMDNFLFHLAKNYFSTIRQQLNAITPGRLYMCTTGLGGWGAPPRAPVLEAAGQICDVISLNTVPTSVASDDQARANFISSSLKANKPWIEWVGVVARADSYEGTIGNPNGPTDTVIAHQSSQSARGAAFTGVLNRFLTMTDSTYNTVHVAGYRFWAFYDSRGEGENWGLADQRDNAYDGTACNIAGRTDAAGFPILPEIQLPIGACYGDFISPVKQANRLWLAVP